MTRNTNTADPEEAHGSGDTDQPTRLKRIRSTVSKRDREGTGTALIGGILLAAAVRTARRNRRRAGAFALAGGVLLDRGLRRRAEAGISAAGDDAEAHGEGGGEAVSAEARAHLERAHVLHQSETNPRGVAGEPDVETETDPDEGDIRFTTEQEVERAEPKPHLDGDAKDPRLHDEDDPDVTDDHVEVSLSETAMADEASEAVGPTDEQAYPASEGTDPEPMPDEAPPRNGGGAGADEGPEDEDTRADGKNREEATSDEDGSEGDDEEV